MSQFSFPSSIFSSDVEDSSTSLPQFFLASLDYFTNYESNPNLIVLPTTMPQFPSSSNDMPPTKSISDMTPSSPQ